MSEIPEVFKTTEEIILYAFRYALGRMSYSTGTMSNYLINNWHIIKPHTRKLIVMEIEEAIKRDEAGQKCDIDNWRRVLEESTASIGRKE